MPRIGWRFGLSPLILCLAVLAMPRPGLAADAPKFEIDAYWPKPLPNKWIFGQIGGIFQWPTSLRHSAKSAEPRKSTVWFSSIAQVMNRR